MIARDVRSRVRQLGHLVGNTPLLAIELRVPRRHAARSTRRPRHLNLTGSIKDRMALHILRAGRTRRRPRARATDRRGDERQHRHRVLRRRARDGPPGDDLHARLDEPRADRPDPEPRAPTSALVTRRPRAGSSGASGCAEECAESKPARSCRGSSRTKTTAPRTRRRPAPRSAGSCRVHGLEPDAFVAGVGTGGTVMGVGPLPEERSCPKVTIHPLEPANSPTLSDGHKVGKHRIQGISDEFIPPIVDLGYLDRDRRGGRWRRDPDGAEARAAARARRSGSRPARTSSARSRCRTRWAPTRWWSRSSRTTTRST